MNIIEEINEIDRILYELSSNGDGFYDDGTHIFLPSMTFIERRPRNRVFVHLNSLKELRDYIPDVDKLLEQRKKN